MKLATVALQDLHLPRDEWRWLRPTATEPSLATASPDAFLWAAKVDGKLWAWHPRGLDLPADLSPATQLRVLELESDGSELEAHGLYLKTVFSAQPAHDAEWVAALQVARERLSYDVGTRGLPKWWKEALESCGLEAHLGVLAQRGKYAFMSRGEQKLVVEKRWDLSAIETLELMGQTLRESCVGAIRKWNLSAGQTKETLNYVLILWKKMGEKTALNVLNSPFKSAEEFRLALFRTAQPELATLSQKRLEMLRNLKVPPRSTVFGDPSFESDTLKITHTPRTPDDFDLFRRWVMEPVTFERIRELLEIYQ